MKNMSDMTGDEVQALNKKLSDILRNAIPSDCCYVLLYQSAGSDDFELQTNIRKINIVSFLTDKLTGIAITFYEDDIKQMKENN
jgi:hypothetical protein